MLEPGDKVEKQLPAWKQSLIERRRLQEALEARQREEEEARLAQLPQWKREVLLRKQNKSSAVPNGLVNGGDVHGNVSDEALPRTRKNSSNRSSVEPNVSDNPPLIAADVDASATDEERLLPLIHNPILRRDLERRRTLKPILHRIVIDPKPRSSRPKAVDASNEVQDIPKKAPEVVSDDAQKPAREEVKVNDAVQTVEESEEMVYGHGFVSKLRDRFRQLTEKPGDVGNSLQPRCRSHSSDNLLDDSPSQREYSAHGPEPSFGRKGRAYSVDNLASESKTPTAQSEKTINSLRPLDNHQEAANGQGGKPELSTVKTVKNVPTKKSNAVVTCNVRHSFSDPNFRQNLDPKISRNTSESNTVVRPSNTTISSVAEDETDSSSEVKKLHERSASPPPEVNELPKPNTVMNVRTIFEKVGTPSSAPPSSTGSSLAKPKTVELPFPVHSSEPTSEPPPVSSSHVSDEAKPAVLPIRIAPKKISASDILKDRNRGHDASSVSANNVPLPLRQNSNSSAHVVQGKTPLEINANGLATGSISKSELIQDILNNEASKADTANRKNLNLNLSDLSQTKNTRKAVTVAMVIGQNDDGWMQNARQMPDFSSEDIVRNEQPDYGDEYDGNGIPYSSYSDEYFDDYGTDDDLSDYDDDDLPREGDPTVYRRRSVRPVYEFEGAGVIVERSLLAKSKNGKQRKIVFDDDAISTHEYPSEKLLHELLVQEDGLVDGSNGGYTGSESDSYHVDDYDELDSALTSYQSRSVVNHYVIGQSLRNHDDHESHDKLLPPPSEPTSNHDAVELRPVDSESVTWSNEATSDLLF